LLSVARQIRLTFALRGTLFQKMATYMEVCYWALLFMPLVILHHLLNVFVQLANKRGFTKKKKFITSTV
jgi:hypothetical protein